MGIEIKMKYKGFGMIKNLMSKIKNRILKNFMNYITQKYSVIQKTLRDKWHIAK